MKIPNFTNMYFDVNRGRDYFGADAPREMIVEYNAKIKLHGTNSAINLHVESPVAQKRTSIITSESDNFDFAKWVEHVFTPMWLARPEEKRRALDCFVVHGEWCGPGVQKGVSCSSSEKRYFAVYAMEFKQESGADHIYYTDPLMISILLDGLVNEDQVFVLPWFYDENIRVDLYDRDLVGNFLEKVNCDVEEIGRVDPWVLKTFGVSGPGEGLVFYDAKEERKHLIFKAKSEGHRTVKTRNAAQVDPEKASERINFAKMVVTDARLEQAYGSVSETNGQLTMKNVPDFLRWIASDVQKECFAEMSANGYDWKQVAKAVNAVAVNWYSQRVNTIQ